MTVTVPAQDKERNISTARSNHSVTLILLRSFRRSHSVALIQPLSFSRAHSVVLIQLLSFCCNHSAKLIRSLIPPGLSKHFLSVEGKYTVEVSSLGE